MTKSKQYSESGTMGSGEQIENKAIPVGMNLNFIIPFFSFCFLRSAICFICVCVYGILLLLSCNKTYHNNNIEYIYLHIYQEKEIIKRTE